MAYFLDKFTATAGTNLEAHTSDSGHTWTQVTALSNSEQTISPSGECWPGTGSGTNATQYRTNYTPGPTEVLTWQFTFYGGINGTLGIAFNYSATADTGYLMRNTTGTQWDLFTFTAGSAVGLATSPATWIAGHIYEVVITPNGSGNYVIRSRDVTAGGALASLFNVTDTGHPSGVLGLHDQGPMTATTGLHTVAIWSGTPTKVTLTGPTSGAAGFASGTMTATLDAPAPSGGMAIALAISTIAGTFSPASLSIPGGSLAGMFTFTPSGVGNGVITASGTGLNAGTLSYVASGGTATTYTVASPAVAYVGSPTAPLVVTPVTAAGAAAGATGTVTLTPSGGGLSSPLVLTLSGNTPQSGSFSPTTPGTVTITATNTAGLANPANGSLTVLAIPASVIYFSTVSGFAAGLTTVGYTITTPGGSTYAPRQVGGVVSLSAPGSYGALISVPAGYPIAWDDGQSSPRKATDVAPTPGGLQGTVNANLTQLLGSPVSTPAVAGVMPVDVQYSLGQPVLSGVARGGSASGITLGANASSVDHFYDNQTIFLATGKGAGQVRTILSSTGSTGACTVDVPWQVVPDATSGYVFGGLNLAQLNVTQMVPLSNAAHTIGDSLNAARAEGFGAWAINTAGTQLSLYAADGTTIVRSFTITQTNRT
jgi:hypothetical protein